MGRMFGMMYDGKEADAMTKDELIEAILNECGASHDAAIKKAMAEALRCGFIRGEEYGRTDAK